MGHDRKRRGPAIHRTRDVNYQLYIKSTAPLKCTVFSPIVTSDELWVSRKRFRWCQTRGTQSMIFTSSALRVRLPISTSISFLLRYRPRNPFTGSVWLAQSTHLLGEHTVAWAFSINVRVHGKGEASSSVTYLKLWWSCRLGADDVAWLMVPIM